MQQLMGEAEIVLVQDKNTSVCILGKDLINAFKIHLYLDESSSIDEEHRRIFGGTIVLLDELPRVCATPLRLSSDKVPYEGAGTIGQSSRMGWKSSLTSFHTWLR